MNDEAIRGRLDYLLGEADLGAPELHDALRAVLDVLRKWNGEACLNRREGRSCVVCNLRDEVRQAIDDALAVTS